jgi:DNA-binding transcriptional regulator GbsR (MarR family)
MDSREREHRRSELLDKLAGVLEAVGFPHAIARTYAALTLAEGEGLSSSELVEQLGVSKASVSNATQFLVGTAIVERYRVRGSRETHYRLIKGIWGDVLAKKFASMSYMRKVTADAMEAVESPAACERLEEMHEVFAFFEVAFADVMDQWNERKKR